MTDCEHTLPLSKRLFAHRGRGRVCSTCGDFVYVPTPVCDVLFLVSFWPITFLFIAAWLHQGIYLASLVLYLALLVFFYVTEVKHQAPVSYDHLAHNRRTRRHLIALLIIAPALVVWLWWVL